MRTFFIFMAVFVGLAILSNWFWFPEYLLVGVSAILAVAFLVGFVIGLKNTIEEADKKTGKE